MKKFLLIVVLFLLVLTSCPAQERIDSPQDIAWDDSSNSDLYDIAIQADGGEVVFIGQVDITEATIDLDALGYYGVYTVLVRSIALTLPDLQDVSEWARSDNTDDVILVDGVPMTFQIVNKRRAVKPAMLRIK